MDDSRLILITNDDGIESPGLWKLVEALHHLGELLIVAPFTQQTAVGTSMPPDSTCAIQKHIREVDGVVFTAYSVDGTPIQTVQHAILEIAPRVPDFAVAGINYGENIGASVIVSGTLAAALEAGNYGIPSLTISQQMPEDKHHIRVFDEFDFSVAAHFARIFVEAILKKPLPFKVDIIKVDVPEGATIRTIWRLTRVSKHKRYGLKPPIDRPLGTPGRMTKTPAVESIFEADSDVRAILYDKVISVTPLQIDRTSAIDFEDLYTFLGGQ